MDQTPDKVYWIIGFMILTNLGTIFSVITFGGRAIWWVSKLDSRVTKNKQDIDRAHEKLRYIEREVIVERHS